jgi:hypothetical protein
MPTNTVFDRGQAVIHDRSNELLTDSLKACGGSQGCGVFQRQFFNVKAIDRTKLLNRLFGFFYCWSRRFSLLGISIVVVGEFWKLASA